MAITDDMCSRAAEAYRSAHHTIHGYSTPVDERRIIWGPPHWIEDSQRPLGQQVIWRGDSPQEMRTRIEIERMRKVLSAVGFAPALADDRAQGDAK